MVHGFSEALDNPETLRRGTRSASRVLLQRTDD
jgi:hypothetical protein